MVNGIKVSDPRGLDVLMLSSNSRGLLRGLYSTNSLKAFWTRSYKRSGPGSSLNNVLPERNFKKQFSDLSISDLVYISLFNSISAFMGYLMPKPFLKKKSSDTI